MSHRRSHPWSVLLVAPLALSFGAACSEDGDSSSGQESTSGDGDGDGDGDGVGDGDGDGDGTGDGDGDGDAVEGTLTMTVPVFGVFDIPLEAGVPREQALVYELPPEAGTVIEAVVDMEATLPSFQIIRTDGGSNPATPQLEISVTFMPGSHMGSVCEQGEAGGTTVIAGDDQFNPIGVEPAEVPTPQEGIDAINSGTVSACVSVTSSVDAEFSLSEYVLRLITAVSCDDPGDLSGDWSGTYECSGEGGPECGGDGGDVFLTVMQDNHTTAYFDDWGAFYFGSTCGNEFAFFGGGPGYTEYGVLTLVDATNATKQSYYEDTLGPCSGDCFDELTRG